MAIGEMTMTDDAELPDDIQQLVDKPKKDLKRDTTLELLEKLQELESYVLDEVSSPFDIEEAFDHNQWLGDQIHGIRDLLRERFDAADAYRAEENQNEIEKLEEQTDGMQVAIDRLKVHGHEGGVETYSINYPGKRDD